MPFIPTPDAAVVDVVYLWDGKNVENTLSFTFDAGGPTLADLTTLTDAINSYLTGSLLPVLSSAVQLIKLVGTLVDVISGLQYISTTGLPVVGGGGAPAVMSNVSIAVKFATGHSGRSFRGRNFIVGIPAASVDHDIVDGTLRAAILTSYNGLQAAVNAHGWSWVVISKHTAHAPRVAGLPTRILSASFVNNVVDTQRRRLPDF